jgi:hypothetical protein
MEGDVWSISMNPLPLFALAVAIGAITLSASCTTAPTRNGYLTTYDGLASEKGIRGKRLSTPPASGLPEDAPLVIDSLVYAPGAAVSDALTEKDRALLLNQFGRALCAGLSKPFAIGPAAPGAYRLRAAVTEARATGRLGAAASTAMTLGLPIGVRPPMGLGGFAAEMEVIAPDGRQVAAMVWKQSADMASGGPRISRIGDAYDFAQMAADDFRGLFAKRGIGASARRLTGIRTGGPDDACKAYGEESDLISVATGLIGVSAPPEWSDRDGSRAGQPAH